jgi:hypothetical protein
MSDNNTNNPNNNQIGQNPSADQNSLYDENAYVKLRQRIKPEAVNENYDIKFEGVIKDLSNTNLNNSDSGYASYDSSSPWINQAQVDNGEIIEISQVPTSVAGVSVQKPLETIKSATLDNNSKENVISFEQKLGFWDKGFGKILKKFWWLFLSFLVLVLAGVFFLVTTNQKENKPAPILEKISVVILGESSVPRGSVQKWNLKINNAEAINIENLKVNMEYDPAFKFVRSTGLMTEGVAGKSFTLDSLKAGTEVIQTFEGKYDANIDVGVNMLAKLSYEVEGFKGKKNSLQDKTSPIFTTKIKKSLMRIDISNTGSNNIPVESDQVFTITFANQSGERLEKIGLKMEYPTLNQKVIYKSSVLKMTGVSDRITPTSSTDYWELDTVEKDQTGTLVIDYSIRGTVGEKIVFNATLIDKRDGQTINAVSKELFVLNRPVTLKSSLSTGDNFLKESGSVKFNIDIENTSNVELKNFRITAKTEDPTELLDWSTATLGNEKGELRISDKTVSFTGNQIDVFRSFTPKSKFSTSFSIQTKKTPYLSLRTDQAKNFFAKSIVTVEADGMEKITEKGEIVRAKSQPTVTQSVEYLKVDGKYAAKITWSLKNSFAEVKDFRMVARTALQKGAFKQDMVLPVDSKLKFDADSNSVIWSLSSIPAYQGNQGNPLETSFVLVNTTDSKINFLDTVVYTATDTSDLGLTFDQASNSVVGPTNIPFKEDNR